MYSKTLRLGTALVGVGLVVTACGTTTASQKTSQGDTFQGQRSGRTPGVSGLVAAVSGSTAQVQDGENQTAVSWTSSTQFTVESNAGADAVKVGDCVMAQAVPTGAPPSAGAAPTTIAATTVRIVASNGACTGAPGGAFGGGQRPSGAPSALPSGAANRAARFGAFGQVTATTGGATPTITVQSVRPGASNPTAVTVTTTASTTYVQTVPGAADAVKTGVCVTANGKPDSTGAVAATRIDVSQPVNGQCASRAFRGGPNGSQFGGPNGGGAPAGAPNGQA